MKKFYLYTEGLIHRTIKEIFLDFEIHIISKEDIRKKNLTNKNIFLILKEGLPVDLSEVFFFKKQCYNFLFKTN